jgi:hypothetical protein
LAVTVFGLIMAALLIVKYFDVIAAALESVRKALEEKSGDILRRKDDFLRARFGDAEPLEPNLAAEQDF